MTEENGYTNAIQELLDIPAQMPLKASSPNYLGASILEELSVSDLFEGIEIKDSLMADAVRSGLWLRFDSLPQSHDIISNVDSATGCLWHGILHRREGDYPNARYWMHQAGNHPVYPYLAQGAGAILAQMSSLDSNDILEAISQWDAIYFVKLCERGVREGGELESFCLQVQDLEWKILFNFCFQSALGQF